MNNMNKLIYFIMVYKNFWRITLSVQSTEIPRNIRTF